MNLNKSKQIVFFSILILVLLIFSGCSQRENLFSGEVTLNKENLLELKNPFELSNENIIDFVDENQTMEKFLDVLQDVSWDKDYNKFNVINKKEAEEDLDIYFKTLKDCYAGYLP